MDILFFIPIESHESKTSQPRIKTDKCKLSFYFKTFLLSFLFSVVALSACTFYAGTMRNKGLNNTNRHNIEAMPAQEPEAVTNEPEVVAEIEGDLITTTTALDDSKDSRPVVYQIISSKGRMLIMAKVNTRFCKPAEDCKSLVYAPVVLPPKLGTPTDEDYLAAGWFYNSVQPPEVPDGMMVSSVSYYIDGEDVFAEYEFVEAPAPIRTFSKLKLYGALVQAGLWDSLVTWLQNQTVNGMNAYTAFSLAQDLSDAHPLFQSWYAQIKSDLGISDEDGEAILSAALAE